MARADQTSQFKITTKGEAEISLPAERGVLAFSVKSHGTDKAHVTGKALQTVRQIETLLRQMGPQNNTQEAKDAAAIVFWSRTSMSVSSNRPYNSDTRTYGKETHDATVQFEAHFQKFGKIATCINALADVPLVESQKIKWELSKETRDAHQSGLREQAATHALAKAKDYACALGYSKVLPLEIKEAQAYVRSSHRKMGRIPSDSISSVAKNMAADSMDGEEWEEVKDASFDYRPEDVQMSLSVDAVFVAE